MVRTSAMRRGGTAAAKRARTDVTGTQPIITDVTGTQPITEDEDVTQGPTPEPSPIPNAAAPGAGGGAVHAAGHAAAWFENNTVLETQPPQQEAQFNTQADVTVDPHGIAAVDEGELLV
jgi:hypothetical protein